MKLALALLACLYAAPAIAQIPAAQIPPEFGERAPLDWESRFTTLGGGDTFATATVITTLPFTDIATVCGYANDYESRCGGALGEDVVYRYTPASDECVDISLCGSIFDTILSVISADTLVACNNDGCNSQASRISRLSLQGGSVYYIVIDNGGATCGKYYLSVSPCCDVSCPPGAIAENEACCIPAPIPTCTAVMLDLPCEPEGVDVCGTYQSLDGARDADWYRIQVSEPSLIHLEVNAESPTLIGILNWVGSPSPMNVICAKFNNAYCQPATCDAGVAAGTYYLYVAPLDYFGVPCGTVYSLHASCTPSGVTAMGDLHANDVNGIPARAGQTFSVVGVITGLWPSGSQSRFTLEDGTGGIAVIGAPAWCRSVSDQVAVRGVLGQVDGWTALVPPLDLTFLHGGVATPDPVLVTPDDINGAFQNGSEPLESRLVQLMDVEIRNNDGSAVVPGALFEAGVDYQVVSLKTERGAPLRILADANDCAYMSPLAGTPIPTGCALNVTSVLAQFDASPPYQSGYALLPRYIQRKCSVRAVATTWARLKAQYR